MRIIESAKLKLVINDIKDYLNASKSIEAIFNGLQNLNIESIQSVSYEKDLAFFDDISFVLSVIITIINHPHINSHDVDEIIRADLAGHIENDSFQMVFKDPRLWREKEQFEMIPENVYYHEHIDELKIYENIFIGMLINKISNELVEYNNFYVSLLPSLGTSNDLISSEEVDNAINIIARETRKINYIKNSFFYKQIKKCNLNLQKIEPTNILLKDRLYNYCFKFYKKIISYEDQESLLNDLNLYNYMLILKDLKNRGFSLQKNMKSIYDLDLNKENYFLNIKLNTNKPNISFDVSNNNIHSESLLVTDSKRVLIKDKDYVQFDGNILTPWNLYDGYNCSKLSSNDSNESMLVKQLLDNKFNEVKATLHIYDKYCPICKAKSVDEQKGLFTCSTCGSQYAFIKNDKDTSIWFVRVRRS